jgi:hypothetical protein
MGRSIILIFFGMIFAVQTSFAVTPEEEGYQIAKKAFENTRNFSDEKNFPILKLVNANGQEAERYMVGITLERQDAYDYALLQFLNPPDVRGTGLLTYQNPAGDDKQWLYLPELRRVKKISSSNKSGSFMGSEFAYEDITGNTLARWNYKKIGEGELNGKPCFIIEKYPNYKNSGYSKVKSWITKDQYLTSRSEMFDRKKSLLKVQTFSKWKKYGNTWRSNEIVMNNLQTKKKSILTIRNREFGNNLSVRNFSKSTLQRLIKQ